MGKRAAGAATAYSLRVVAAIRVLRDRAEITNTELMRRAGFSANYFYTRLRGESPFDLNDLDRIARALSLDVHDITHLASSLPDPSAEDETVLLDGAELRRRLAYLSNSVDGTPEINDLSTSTWALLTSGQPEVNAPKLALIAIADFFHVTPVYVTDFQAFDVTERVEAELELGRALHDAGATPIAARALGGLSPSALLAVAESIRSIDLGNDAR